MKVGNVSFHIQSEDQREVDICTILKNSIRIRIHWLPIQYTFTSLLVGRWCEYSTLPRVSMRSSASDIHSVFNWTGGVAVANLLWTEPMFYVVGVTNGGRRVENRILLMWMRSFEGAHIKVSPFWWPRFLGRSNINILMLHERRNQTSRCSDYETSGTKRIWFHSHASLLLMKNVDLVQPDPETQH